MADQLRDIPIGAGSSYTAALRTIREQNAAGLDAAKDPDEVARVVEECIGASDPPARVVVGADALEMDATVRQSSPDELVRLLREFVASLAPTS